MNLAVGLYASGPEAGLLLRGLSKLASDPLARELNVNRLRVLLFLYNEDRHEAYLGRIAPILGLSSPFLSRCGDALVDLGLITRDKDDDNKRIMRFQLTEAGVEFCNRIAGTFAGIC